MEKKKMSTFGSTKMEKALENLQLMMLNRGYVFISRINEQYLIYANTDNDRIIVWYYPFEKLNIEGMKEFVNNMESENFQHGIIIYENILTSSTKKVLENMYKFQIELFLIKELQYDITKFKYFCHHEKVSLEKAKIVKERFGNSIPILLKSDVVSRYFNFQKNDIIEIKRRNGTIVYRLVK